jgi:alpha-L-fucosidase
LENVAPLQAQGFNEGKGKPFVPQDIRLPENGSVSIKSLSKNNYKEITKIELLSKNQELRYQQTEEGLIVSFPNEKPQLDYAHALKIV